MEPEGEGVGPGHEDAERQVFGIEYPQAADIVPPGSKGWIERIEEAAAALFFGVMFATLVAGVIWRYAFNRPLLWTVGVSTLGFIWAALIGSGLSDRDDGHIQFDLVYNRVSERVQTAFRIVGNAIIVVTFLAVVPATVSYLDFMSRSRVVGLRWLSFDWAYLIIGVFFVTTALHRGRLLVRDVRSLRRTTEDRA
jgi:TRAP-type C4-dicarboxylate transport system permease small subunit